MYVYILFSNKKQKKFINKKQQLQICLLARQRYTQLTSRFIVEHN